MTEPIQHLQLALEIIATISLALSGLISAARKQLDPVGICMVSGVAAFGGGTLRDILLDRRQFSGLKIPTGCGPCWPWS